jgi:hypothetical protein
MKEERGGRRDERGEGGRRRRRKSGDFLNLLGKHCLGLGRRRVVQSK